MSSDIEKIPIGQIQIKSVPSQKNISDFDRLQRLLETCRDMCFALSLQSECLNTKYNYALANKVTLNLPMSQETEIKLNKLLTSYYKIDDAVNNVKKGNYGMLWRNNDFDILSPTNSSSMDGLYKQLSIGLVIISGCFAALYKLGTDADILKKDYKTLNKKADDALCADPSSDLCTHWKVVKEQSNITEKEGFIDKIKSVAKTGTSIALALIGGMLALSIVRK